MDNDAKLRPLYLGKILYERTDEEHYLSTNELIEILKAEYDISSHRQTIATEIELLKPALSFLKRMKAGMTED